MTRLLYLDEMTRLRCEATVTSVESRGDVVAVGLDQTVFYPQGGGQPYDTGVIRGTGGELTVEQVRWEIERVAHIGKFTSGTLTPGDAVTCEVDAPRRALHTRLHSAGHVVDMAVDRLGYGWTPGKGYHFPDGPYVEYAGAIDGDKDEVRIAIERVANEIVGEGLSTEVRFVERDELASLCRFVPDYVPLDKPSRVVLYGAFGVPCGGTHVSRLADIGKIAIRKLKPAGATVRVSYQVEQ